MGKLLRRQWRRKQGDAEMQDECSQDGADHFVPYFGTYFIGLEDKPGFNLGNVSRSKFVPYRLHAEC